MSTHNIGFYEDLTKIIFELSSNMHLISPAVYHLSRFVRKAVLPSVFGVYVQVQVKHKPGCTATGDS